MSFNKYVTKVTHNAGTLIMTIYGGETMARRILVVEDEAPIREMLCFVLEQNGFHAIEAEDYPSAVNLLAEPYPDLVLLDWMLPGGSGIQFIKQMKREALSREIPVVMLTARGEEEDRVRGLEVGADDYITKPFISQRATGADKSGAAAHLPDGGGRANRASGPESGSRLASGDRQRAGAGYGVDRIQAAAFLYGPS